LRANGIYRRLIERGDLPHTNVSVIYRALRQMCDAALLLSHRSAGRAMCYSLAPQSTQNPVLRVTTSHGNGSGSSSVTISDPRLCAQILAAIAQKGLQVGDAKLSLHIRLARQRRGAQTNPRAVKTTG
jgi:Fe2+ or Zn2+ uptake regulation protein